MTVKTLGNGTYTGLSTDTKPTAANIAVDAIFDETNTGKRYYNNGTAWVGASPSKYSGARKVYKIGATYYAENPDGSLIASSGTFETVLQASLDLQGVTYMDTPGTYTFNSEGVYIGQYTKLVVGGMTTIIAPPASSAGFTCIKMGNHPTMTHDTRHAMVVGARLRKATGEQDWTGIEILSDNDQGNTYATVQDVLMYFPGTGIKFITTGLEGWISTFNINRTAVYFPLVGVDFVKGGTRDSPFRGLLDDVTIQSLPQDPPKETLFGFKNVQWKDITFRDCKVWDLAHPLTQNPMSIAPTAYDIHILGGTIARTDIGFRMADNSTQRATTIMANDWQGPSYGTEPLTQTIFVRNGRRKGGWEPTTGIDAAGSTMGWGMVAGPWTNHAVGGAGSAVTVTYANGTAHRSYPTGTATGNGAGIRYPHLISCRGWNPVYKIKFKLHNATSNRLVLGWVGSTSFDASIDIPLTGLNGFALGSRAADTTFHIFHNDGVGVGSAPDTGIPLDTAVHTFELVAQDDITVTNNKWKYAIDGTWVQLTTTDMPAQDVALAPYAQIATGTAATRGFDIFGLYVESQ